MASSKATEEQTPLFLNAWALGYPLCLSQEAECTRSPAALSPVQPGHLPALVSPGFLEVEHTHHLKKEGALALVAISAGQTHLWVQSQHSLKMQVEK